MSGRGEVWLFAAQRLSAMVLAPLVLLHLATMIYAVQDGLSAAEILARTRGSVFWGAMYALFIAAASVHGAIGLRAILREWTPLRGAAPSLAAMGFGVVVLVLGWRAMAVII
jgi:fumarate reductase subunit C